MVRELRSKREAAEVPREPNQGKVATLYCSFCGKSQHDVRKLIAGQNVCICNECIAVCVDICINDKPSNEPAT
ncbi:hypothetical protein FOB51_12520 [Paracoccus yeei]|uniref:ClpX-type ZB domain-containing protein n=1 Tax=Paracoccus yeei TaxID=147645 RepID=A0A5P2QWZ2_9RHOB|nr:hypothetical protein FOB51_12520 [Paracoccus yeei]